MGVYGVDIFPKVISQKVNVIVWLGFDPAYFEMSKVSKVSDQSRGLPEGSLFDSYYTKVSGRALLLSLDCSTLPLILTLLCWVLSIEASSTIFLVFGMTRRGIEPRSAGPLANNSSTLNITPWWSAIDEKDIKKNLSYLTLNLKTATPFSWRTHAHTHTHTHIYIHSYIYTHVYGEKVDIFGKSDQMMKNKLKSGYTKTQTDSVQNISFIFIDRTFSIEKNIYMYVAVHINANVYTYTDCHPQTDCFVVSQLFMVTRHARFFKLGSKPGWFYVGRISYPWCIIILA